MALIKQTAVDSINITESGHVEVREVTRIMEDGVQLSFSYHRHVLAPGDDTAGETARVQAVAKATWTRAVVDQYKARVAAVE
tara:strand:- start:171 stop:416 length:246 start_codon:yes stop_codon:yes gene_type:complete